MKLPLSTFVCLGLLLYSVSGLQAQIPYGHLLKTITNQTPNAFDQFGAKVAAMAHDRLVIGAPGSGVGGSGIGAAFLYGIEGTVLAVVTNPSPASADYFGSSVTAVGSQGMVVGAWGDDTFGLDSGAAYFFDTNGNLITTFTNPTPAANDMFGSTLAAVGKDRVLVGAYGDRTGLAVAGAAYLFGTNGSLITTFGSPSPLSGAHFGGSIVAIGLDRVVIGAPGDSVGPPESGAAYLFSTNGTLLTVFTNPTPDRFDHFGSAVASLGNERVAISATWDSAGAIQSGSVYIFNTNGVLLTTITNPTPGAADNFGWSLASVGNDRILIGPRLDDTGTTNAGAAYLYSSTGALLTTFTNPAPAVDDLFGWSVASLGTDRFVVSALLDDAVATDAGAVYIFEAAHPPLNIAQNASEVSISWAWPEPGLILQQAGLLGDLADWRDAPEVASVTGTTNLVQQPLVTTNRFYRLRRP